MRTISLTWNCLRDFKLCLAVFLSFAVVACSGPIVTENVPVPSNKRKDQIIRGPDAEVGSVWGEGGIFGLGDRNANAAGLGGIGVNSFLWRATLDTILFMPISSADPFGGVIMTDWHSTPESPNERFKMNVFILDRSLRADGIKVSAFRQVFQNQIWHDAELPTSVNNSIEESILTRARQLRLISLGGE